MTRQAVHQFEVGKTRPSPVTLQILAERYGKPLAYFLEEDVVSDDAEVFQSELRRMTRVATYRANHATDHVASELYATVAFILDRAAGLVAAIDKRPRTHPSFRGGVESASAPPTPDPT